MSKSASINSLPASLSRSGSAEYVASRWCMLPPHVREAIVTLVDAGFASHSMNQPLREASAEGEHEEH